MITSVKEGLSVNGPLLMYVHSAACSGCPMMGYRSSMWRGSNGSSSTERPVIVVEGGGSASLISTGGPTGRSISDMIVGCCSTTTRC